MTVVLFPDAGGVVDSLALPVDDVAVAVVEELAEVDAKAEYAGMTDVKLVVAEDAVAVGTVLVVSIVSDA
jgi:hypothetical protein